MSVNSVPFGPTESAVLSPEGYFIHAISKDYSLTLLRNPGPALRIEKVYSPVPVTPGERAEEEQGAIRNMRHTDPNWRWNGPQIPDVKPPFSRFFAGEDGTVWVLAHQKAEEVEDPFFDPSDPEAIADVWKEPVVFDVFEQDGSYLGAVRAPKGFRTYPAPIFTRDWVMGTLRDEFDVQTVVKFRVELPGLEPTEDRPGHP